MRFNAGQERRTNDKGEHYYPYIVECELCGHELETRSNDSAYEACNHKCQQCECDKQKHPLYRTWANMIQRTTNPNNPGWEDYGGRGITMCDKWRNDFYAFVEDVGAKPTPEHSIERKDNNKGYSRFNCKWATQKEQCNNRRAKKGSK